MKIIADRITKDTDANSIKHYYLLDDRISWKAKGIMYFLLNADDDYDYSIQDLAQRSSDGREKVSSGIRELKQSGYRESKYIRDERGVMVAVRIHEYL